MQENSDYKINSIDYGLVCRIKKSDSEAFKDLCKIYYEALYRFLWRRTFDKDISFDLVQELFINVWKNREHLDENRPVKAYLYKAAANLSINHLKSMHSRRTVSLGELEDHTGPASNNETESDMYVENILSRLPEKQRTVFELNKFEGLKYSEIAEILQVSVKTIEARMSNALRSLRKMIKMLML